MRAYLDHAAATPLRARALQALVDASSLTGNTSSVHEAGRAARRLLEDAREQVAAAAGVHPGEVVFTSGGTESDNLAVVGLYRSRGAGAERPSRILVSSVEHHAVLEPARWLARHEGATVELLPVDGDGVVDLDVLADELARGGVALVSLMWANNEVGAIQPVEQAVALADRFAVPVHVDAVQAFGQVVVDLERVPAAAVSVSGHKVGGPGGTGALIVRRGTELAPLLHGGGQESGRRSGTVPVAPLAGFASALTEAVQAQGEHAVRLGALRDDLVAGILAATPGAVLRGPVGPDARLPGNAHLTFDGCAGEDLLYLLDAAGVDASTGSACQAGVARSSHVLEAMGIDEGRAGALRLSLGHTSTSADVAHVLAVLPGAVERARAVRTAGAR